MKSFTLQIHQTENDFSEHFFKALNFDCASAIARTKIDGAEIKRFALWENETKSPRQIITDEVQAIASKHGSSFKEVLSPFKSANIVAARFEAYTLVWESTGWNFVQVGRFFKRDHSTIMYGIGAYLFKQGRNDGPVRTYLARLKRSNQYNQEKEAA